MIWRTQYNVPEVYPAESRDFQLIGRLLDSVTNGVKFNIDSMSRTTSARDIMSTLLPLLQDKLGFFSDAHFTDIELRYVLDAFPTIMKYKGSKKAIREAVNVFLRLNCIDARSTTAYINIGEDSQRSSSVIYGDVLDKYTIFINIKSAPRDTKVLDEIFRYILPPGYTVVYKFYDTYNKTVFENLEYFDEVSIDVRDNIDNNLRPTIQNDTDIKTSAQAREVGTIGAIEVSKEVKSKKIESAETVPVVKNSKKARKKG